MIDLQSSIALIRRDTPAGDPWTGADLVDDPREATDTDDAIAAILNAVVAGDLIQPQNVDEVLEQAAEACADYPGVAPSEDEWTRYDEQITHSQQCIRALKSQSIPAPAQVVALKRLIEAVKSERHHKSAYDATPTDRGGAHGPKGRAYQLWCDARADVGDALAAMEASHD